ncbi:chaperonin 10-like protein [Pseudoneurospora amorphoporcata]|uniref:Chaperonin 10-like protein n=1 Tax=Pseudoneurospora amorphoporcata TaxID=241081 RepID=A0AAN6SHB4_9PEZI|nr:chaperonin 10-like protein [Pseudoneurospora amorphoporcata]
MATTPRTTTALVVPELNGQFELQQVQLNEIQPEEVLVEIEATGICHTDLSCAIGLLPCRPGAVLGHEGGGKVLSVGSAVTHVTPGDLVLLSFSHCESCGPCLSGNPAHCYSFNVRNFSGCRPLPTLPDGSVDASQFTGDPAEDPARATFVTKDGGKPLFSQFFGQSSFARHTLVHKSSCVKVPQDTDLALFASLGCGMQTGAGAVLNTLKVKPGSSIAVFGVGSVGMAALMAAAHIAKAKTIIAIDLQPSRLELAKKLGATHGVLGNVPDVKAEVRKICPPVGVDYAVDCTGAVPVIKTMIDVLGTKGRGATVGAPGFGKTVQVDVMEHLTYGKEYVGSCEGDSCPKEFVPFLIEQHAKGNFPMDQFVTYYDMKDYKQALEDTHKGKAIKAVLKW